MKKRTIFSLFVASLIFPVFVFAALPVEPTATLTASPNPVNPDSESIYAGMTNLTWSSTNADTCVVTEGGESGFDTKGATSGSDWSDVLSAPTTFAISCTGFGGTATAQVVVGVIGGGGDDDVPTATLGASPDTVGSGNRTTLTWSSTNASSCSVTQGASAGFSTGGNVSGSDNSIGLSNTTTFAIRCDGAGGSVSASKTVDVSDGDDDDDDDDGGGGGGGSGGSSSKELLIKQILERLIAVLTELINLIIAQRGA